MGQSFYNTNNLQGQLLFEAEASARTQEDIILEYFKKYPEHIFIPDDIHNLFDPTKTPITSVRRSMTNLTIKGFLIKTDQFRTGKYGKQTHCWKLNSYKPQPSII